MRLIYRIHSHMYYVYILHSTKLNKYYVGSTADLRVRLKEHNSGRVPFTARGLPWRLVFYEAFVQKADATREERFLKTGKGRERRKYLLAEFEKMNVDK